MTPKDYQKKTQTHYTLYYQHLIIMIISVMVLQSDFYMYDTESTKWTLITEDTGAMGGPQLIFDHQMVMDVEKQQLFVFGGRLLTW